MDAHLRDGADSGALAGVQAGLGALVVICLAATVLPSVAQEKAASADTIMTQEGPRAVADLTRSDILRLSYDDLVALPLEALLGLADKMEISVEELLSMKMTVSSKSATTLREQPGILSVITREEIRRSGARDLVDVLRMVPGTFFGSDVNGVTGLGFRGNWAHEGKVLLLVDGQEMNDQKYSIYPYGHHFDVSQIQRVEVIRGPGSSLYGGAAELGVINIVTRQGDDINGAGAGMTYGQLEKIYGRRNLDLSVGKKHRDVEFSVAGFLGDGFRSADVYNSWYHRFYDPSEPFVSDTLSMGHGNILSANANVGLRWKDLSARFLYDYYGNWGIDAYVYDNIYRTYCGELKYDLRLPANHLTLTPKLNFRWNEPWHTEHTDDESGENANMKMWRGNAGVSALFDPLQWLSLSGGMEGYYENDWWEDTGRVYDFNRLNRARLSNGALYLQGLFKTKLTNVTLGGRVERNSQYGWAFAPRIGFTQIISDLNFKLLLSRAFRSPNIGSIRFNGGIRPEYSNVGELELGYRLHKYMFLTANLYVNMMTDPIVYFDEGDVWGYRNGDTVATWGVEAEYALRYQRANVTLNYSFYRMSSRWCDADFSVPGKPGLSLAAPQHKVTLNSSLNPWRGLWVAPSAVVMSRTWGYKTLTIDTIPADPVAGTPEEVSETQTLGSWDPAALLNLYVSYDNLLLKGLSLGAGVYDLLGVKYPWVQAYDGFAPPLPGTGREFVVRLRYDFGFAR